VFGIFLTPVFYVLLRGRREKRLAAARTSEPAAPGATIAGDGSAVLQPVAGGRGNA